MDTKITVDTTYDNTKNMEMAENDIKEIANPSPQNALTQNVKTVCVEVYIVKAPTQPQLPQLNNNLKLGLTWDWL